MTIDEAIKALSRGCCSRERAAETGCEKCVAKYAAIDWMRSRIEDLFAANSEADCEYVARAQQKLPHHLMDVRAGDVVRWANERARAEDLRSDLESAQYDLARLITATRSAVHLDDARAVAESCAGNGRDGWIEKAMGER
jgi:hypothetical protein